MERLVLVIGPGDQGGAGVVDTDEPATDVRRAGTDVLLVPDQLLAQAQPHTAVLAGPADAGVAAVVLRALPGEVEIAAGPPIDHRPGFARHVVVQPVPYPRAELGVGVHIR